MIVCPCPRCDEAFRIPSGNIPDDAYAECPWCHESFPASEFLENLPPVVVLTSSMGLPLQASAPAAEDFSAGISRPSDDASAPGDHFADEPAAADPALDFSGFSSDSDHVETPGPLVQPPQDSELIEPAFQLNDESGAPIAGNALAPMNVSPPAVTTSRPRRKKGSPIKSMIGIVFGGLLALPIAGGILLAFGKAPDLGFYPFDGSFSPNSNRRPAPAFDPGDQATSSATGSSGRSLGPDLSIDIPGEEDASTDPAADTLRELGITPAGDSADVVSSVSADAATDKSTDTQEMSLTDRAESDNDEGTSAPEIELDGEPVAPPPLAPFPDVPAVADATESTIAAPAEPQLPSALEIPAEITLPESAADVADAGNPADDSEMTESPTELTESASTGDAVLSATDAGKQSDDESTKPLIVPIAADSPELVTASQAAFDAVADARGVGPDQSGYKNAIGAAYTKLSAAAAMVQSSDSPSAQQLLTTVRESGLEAVFAKAIPQWLSIAPNRRPNSGIIVQGTLNPDGNALEIFDGSTVPISIDLLSAPPSGPVLGLGKITDSDDGPTVVLSATIPAN